MSAGWSVVGSALAAVAAGVWLAVGGVAQQRAASSRPTDERFSLRLVSALVRDRTWLLGIAAAALSYGFQALALVLGPLVLVQPLIVSELLFAVPFSLRRHQMHLQARDWVAVLAVVVGLALGIVATDPHKGDPTQPFSRWLPVLVVVLLVAAAGVVASRRVDGPGKASALALSGAVVMALQSALYAGTLDKLRHDGFGLVTQWEPYALVVASVAGAYLIQNAFQSGPLAASSPVIDAVLPLVAVGLGVYLFHEPVRTTVVGLVGGGVGLLLMIGGIVGLDTSPLVRHAQRLEREEQKKNGEQEQEQREEAGQPEPG